MRVDLYWCTTYWPSLSLLPPNTWAGGEHLGHYDSCICPRKVVNWSAGNPTLWFWLIQVHPWEMELHTAHWTLSNGFLSLGDWRPDQAMLVRKRPWWALWETMPAFYQQSRLCNDFSSTHSFQSFTISFFINLCSQKKKARIKLVSLWKRSPTKAASTALYSSGFNLSYITTLNPGAARISPSRCGYLCENGFSPEAP